MKTRNGGKALGQKRGQKSSRSEEIRETRRYTNKIDYLRFKNGNLIVRRG